MACSGQHQYTRLAKQKQFSDGWNGSLVGWGVLMPKMDPEVAGDGRIYILVLEVGDSDYERECGFSTSTQRHLRLHWKGTN